MTPLEWHRCGDQVLALVVRGSYAPGRTEFVTPETFVQQVGFVVYPQGGVIAKHYHRPLPRTLTGTPETLVVRSGRLEVILYDDLQREASRTEIGEGDVLVLVSGGHGFRVLEAAVLLEIKQGPYTGIDEKVRF